MWSSSTFSFCAELWPKQNYTHFICLLMGPLQSTWSKWRLCQLHGCSLRTESARSVRELGKFTTYYLLRKAYYSSQVSRVCVASVWVEIWALLTDGTFKQYACEFRAADFVFPLTCSSHGWSLKIRCRQWQQSPKDRSLFRSFSSTIAMHGSGSIVIFATGWLVTRLAPPKSRDSNTSISTGHLHLAERLPSI